MLILYIVLFVLLVAFSAFFSSSETSLLSLNKIKLDLKAKKKNKKAQLLKKTLDHPEDFFSTILIGNNFVNIAAASISTILFTRLLTASEEVVLLASTLATTLIILIFAEVLPKSYAFRHSERLSYLYAYPIKFFKYLLYPFVKAVTFISTLLFKNGSPDAPKKGLTTEEMKHFLSSEIQLFRHNPGVLRMVNEIIDIVEKDIKGIMTPRIDIIGLEASAGMDELMQLVLEKKVSKIPVYRDSLDNIIGVVHTDRLMQLVISGRLKRLSLPEIAVKPIFVSEYSSLPYVFKEFKRNEFDMAVVLDEYGATMGVLTLNDIFSEIVGEIKIGSSSVRRIGGARFLVKGSLPVAEVNARLNIHLPEKKDYATLSGLFIYYFGKFPRRASAIKINDIHLKVRNMGERKIDEIVVEAPNP